MTAHYLTSLLMACESWQRHRLLDYDVLARACYGDLEDVALLLRTADVVLTGICERADAAVRNGVMLKLRDKLEAAAAADMLGRVDFDRNSSDLAATAREIREARDDPYVPEGERRRRV